MALGSLVFGNLPGLWALLAVPSLLLIHLLQRKARRMEISTLFLLAKIAPEASEGRRIDRLKSSLPLWLQLAAIIAVAWVMVEPRWLESSSVQRAVLVLDSSASMSVFREPMIAAVERTVAELDRRAARTEWVVMDSDPSKKTRYAGSDRTAALASVRAHEARGGAHDFGPALAVAQTLAKGRGPVLLVTDHEIAVPAGVSLLAVGRPIDNVGFTGAVVKRSAAGAEWTAMIKNHGRAAAKRALSAGNAAGEEFELAAGEVRTLSGRFPEGEDRVRLVLAADAFPLDDVLPMLRPRGKMLRVYAEPELQSLEVVARLIAGLEWSTPIATPAGADLVIARSTDAHANAIIFAVDDREGSSNVSDPIVAEPGPLTEGLVWQGLLRRSGAPSSITGGEALLWQGDRPLVRLKDHGPHRQLIVDFDPRRSNADRVPSFAVLLLRFVESIRASKRAVEARNVETGQPLQLAVAGEEPITLRRDQQGLLEPSPLEPRLAASLSAPDEPGFFFVQQGQVMLLAGAARFGDLREADLADAASRDVEPELIQSLAVRHSRADPLRPLWILLAGLACGAAWWFGGRR